MSQALLAAPRWWTGTRTMWTWNGPHPPAMVVLPFLGTSSRRRNVAHHIGRML
ncbi:hypothetical protein E2C01_054462 [Portunus trituberculatus]|uniref:Uncharacterized protein n=1 Tax=Portunus trituberculatus TaxID=210409 RepID=A0A5B7GTR3_PORTR|nr:hypothetical protein [Portunus trituberculatus]